MEVGKKKLGLQCVNYKDEFGLKKDDNSLRVLLPAAALADSHQPSWVGLGREQSFDYWAKGDTNDILANYGL